jgi:hypothetical protein
VYELNNEAHQDEHIINRGRTEPVGPVYQTQALFVQLKRMNTLFYLFEDQMQALLA